MKKIILMIIFFISSIYVQINADNYAVYITGTMPKWIRLSDTTGNLDPLSEVYWHDLFLMYEYLIDSAGYNHNNIITFFGRGEDWQTSNTLWRYNIDSVNPEWKNQSSWQGKIVDFDCSESTIKVKIDSLNNILTSNDNLLIIWREHGSGFGQGDTLSDSLDMYNTYTFDYSGCKPIIHEGYPDNGEITNDSCYNPSLSDTRIYEKYKVYLPYTFMDLFDFKDSLGFKNYKRKKMMFFSCHSGSLITGNLKFNDDNSFIIACGNYDETCRKQKPLKNDTSYKPTKRHYWSSQFVSWCVLNDGDPFRIDSGDFRVPISPAGHEGNIFEYASNRNNIRDDNVVSIGELFDEYSVNYWDTLETHPKIGDDSYRAYYTYITEDLKLIPKGHSDMVLDTPRYYDGNPKSFRGYWVDKITAMGEGGYKVIVPNGSKVIFAVGKSAVLKPGFKCEYGGQFRAYVGDIPKDTAYHRAKKSDDKQRNEIQTMDVIEDKSNNYMGVIPNPASSTIDVVYNLQHEGTAQIIITNSYGQQVYYEYLNNINPEREQKLSIDISTFPNGLYFVTLRSPTAAMTKGVVVLK